MLRKNLKTVIYLTLLICSSLNILYQLFEQMYKNLLKLTVINAKFNFISYHILIKTTFENKIKKHFNGKCLVVFVTTHFITF